MNSHYKRNVLRAIKATKWTTGYEGSLSRHMEPVDAGVGWLKQVYTVPAGKSVNTGLLMSLVDSATTTLAIVSGPQMAGITMDMALSNFEPIDDETDALLLYSRMCSIKQDTCHITCDVYSINEAVLFASGRQTKFYHPQSRQPLRHVNLMSRLARVFEQHVRKGMAHAKLSGQKSVEHQVLERSKIIDVAPGYVKTHYQLDGVNDVNPMGFVHGGVTATLVDSITTWCCFASRDGHAGITTDLSVSYLKGIDPKKHPTITLIGRVDQAGRQLSFCYGEVRSEDETVLFATGKQTKAMVPSPGPLTVQNLTLQCLIDQQEDETI